MKKNRFVLSASILFLGLFVLSSLSEVYGQRRCAPGRTRVVNKTNNVRNNRVGNTNRVVRYNKVGQNRTVTNRGVNQRNRVVTNRRVTSGRGFSTQVSRTCAVLPRGSVSISFNNRRYGFADGRYFVPRGGVYVSIFPPIGLRVRVLPPTRCRIFCGGVNYFVASGVFYNRLPNNEYQVVDVPVGAVVNSLPLNANRVELEGFVYYTSNDIYYKAILDDYGNVQYEVVGSGV
ncbi:MAG: hypothetical protein ACJAWV_003750 [Flammeovirgaceae bacterium]|jgi:hypothetical protein